MSNQNPEQIARDNIDKQLTACGWIIQSVRKVNLFAGVGVAVKEYITDVGPKAQRQLLNLSAKRIL